MKIELYERIFLYFTAAMLVAGLAAIGLSVVAAEIHLPASAGRIDPKLVRQTAPFDQPGLREVGDGRYEAAMIAQIWSFAPNEIRVPAGAEVRFLVTSTDVIHGFMIENTTINAMVIPGQITSVRYTFDKPGEYLFICHEYCGTGHHTMFGRVIVE